MSSTGHSWCSVGQDRTSRSSHLLTLKELLFGLLNRCCCCCCCGCWGLANIIGVDACWNIAGRMNVCCGVCWGKNIGDGWVGCVGIMNRSKSLAKGLLAGTDEFNGWSRSMVATGPVGCRDSNGSKRFFDAEGKVTAGAAVGQREGVALERTTTHEDDRPTQWSTWMWVRSLACSEPVSVLLEIVRNHHRHHRWAIEGLGLAHTVWNLHHHPTDQRLELDLHSALAEVEPFVIFCSYYYYSSLTTRSEDIVDLHSQLPLNMDRKNTQRFAHSWLNQRRMSHSESKFFARPRDVRNALSRSMSCRKAR